MRDDTASDQEQRPEQDSNSRIARRQFFRMVGMATTIFTASSAAGIASAEHNPEDRQGTDASPDELIEEMTLDEKIHTVHGHAYEFNPADEDVTGYIPPIPRLNIPDVKMSDGPVGVRHNEATAFPAGISQAATFDLETIRQVGFAMGRECKAKDQDVLLAPAFNIVRVPTLGRAFEYFGEDPYLASRAAVAAIEGIQSTGTIATAKHFVANNQEGKPVTEAGSDGFVSARTVARRGSRQYVSAEVSDRTLHEIYLPAFRAAVQEANVGAVMAAYNRVNGEPVSENGKLQVETLKREWGFDGYIVTDWTAARSTIDAAKDGLDVEMPYGIFFGEPLKRAVQSGVVAEDTLDGKVRRILRQMNRFGILKGDREGPSGAANTETHQRLARRVAAEGAVLLKNDDSSLPVDPIGIDSVAVIGHEIDQAKVGGGGSSDVKPPYSVSPLEGIREALPDEVRIRHTKAQNTTTEAVDIAQASDVVFVFGQGSSTEGHDRANMILDGNQNQLISEVATANDHSVVVLNTGGPVTMPWVDEVPAVLQMWYPGMEDGNATADVLFGKHEPGGRLPVTFGKAFNDYPANTQQQYPGIAGRAEYSEGIFVGYRHFDEHGIEPLFPFGHGLSYTDFKFDDLTTTPDAIAPHETVTVSLTVENVGDYAGSEVVQVYVQDIDANVDRPDKELRAFKKIHLNPGEQTRVEFTLDKEALSFYDEEREAWRVEPGHFQVFVGRSSRDVRLTSGFDVTMGTTYREGTEAGNGNQIVDPGEQDIDDIGGD